jgi:hypothetical protein
MLPQSIFITSVRTSAGKAAARLLIESIQSFGGNFSGCPIWVFATDPHVESCDDLACSQVEVFPLAIPETIRHYLFGDKVFACARAEKQAPVGIQSLIWFDLNCLVIQPPLLYHLGDEFDVALRPVHVRNVGLSPTEPLDVFWKGIYSELGLQDVHSTVTSFVDCQPLRAYFNSHALSVRPVRGLFHRWYMHFEHLVGDKTFQEMECGDDQHQIFLFQALFSTLVVSSLDSQRIRILPPTYNYPYNLQARALESQRAAVLNNLVSLTFEGRTIQPEAVTDIEIREPLRMWLKVRTARVGIPRRGIRSGE